MVAKGDKNSRACQALESLGWPVLEGAISTLLGVLALATVDAYMIVTFFKTVFLVILFGLLHACVFLPVLLTMFGSQAKCPSPMRLFSRSKYTVNPWVTQLSTISDLISHCCVTQLLLVVVVLLMIQRLTAYHLTLKLEVEVTQVTYDYDESEWVWVDPRKQLRSAINSGDLKLL